MEENQQVVQTKTIILGASSSVIGGRRSQQDRYYLDINESMDNAVAVICDGMGGMQSGDMASDLAILRFSEVLNEIRYAQDINIRQSLENAAKEIDREVASLTDSSGQTLDTGTTVVSVLIRDGKAWWMSVGDSKIYVIREGEIFCVVREHIYLTVLNDLYQEGKISREKYEAEAFRGAGLISYIGMGEIKLIDSNEQALALRDKDVILLCSDGLSNALTDQEIMEVILANPDRPGYLHHRLQKKAAAASDLHQDNTTIISLTCRIL